MTTVALPVTNKITIDSEKTVAFTAMTAQFGDGYEQIAAKGINNKRETWKITWGGLTSVEKDTVETALTSVGAWGILTWTPCGESVQKRYRLDKGGYTVKREGGSNGIYMVDCSIKQVFDLN